MKLDRVIFANQPHGHPFTIAADTQTSTVKQVVHRMKSHLKLQIFLAIQSKVLLWFANLRDAHSFKQYNVLKQRWPLWSSTPRLLTSVLWLFNPGKKLFVRIHFSPGNCTIPVWKLALPAATGEQIKNNKSYHCMYIHTLVKYRLRL